MWCQHCKLHSSALGCASECGLVCGSSSSTGSECRRVGIEGLCGSCSGVGSIQAGGEGELRVAAALQAAEHTAKAIESCASAKEAASAGLGAA